MWWAAQFCAILRNSAQFSDAARPSSQVAALERRAERARAALERAGFYRFGSSRDGAGGSRDGSPEPGGPPHGSRRKTLGGTPLAVPGTKPSLVDATAAGPPELSTTRGDSAESLRDSAATAHSKASTLDKDSRLEPSRKPPEQIAVDAAHMDMSHPAFHMEAAFPFYLKNSIFWLLLGFAVLLIGAATFAYVEEIDEVDSGGGLRHWSDLPWPDGPTSYGARYARAFYFCWVSLTTVGYAGTRPEHGASLCAQPHSSPLAPPSTGTATLRCTRRRGGGGRASTSSSASC